jgi:XTP/dITP diphosphohydrolase
MKLLFATNNRHKIEEVQALTGSSFQLTGLADAGITEELPETGNTMQANALQKARYAFEKCGLVCFADDSGLEVEALDMAPGVYSARYAGPQKNDSDNMDKLLRELENKNNRRAQFRTVIAFTDGKQDCFFEGIVKGTIISERRGTNGFGYDPLFVPDGYEKTFAEMQPAEKNALSHRARAMDGFLVFLKNYS